MNDNDRFLYYQLKDRKLKFFKDRHIRKLRKYLQQLYEPTEYDLLFGSTYFDLVTKIAFQKEIIRLDNLGKGE